MKIKIISIVSIILMLTVVSIAQTAEFKIDKRKEITIQSWKKGKETVGTQQTRLDLSLISSEYQQEIVGNFGKRYLIQIDYCPYSGNLDLEHWKIKMYEILESEQTLKLSQNLLSTGQYGSVNQDAYIGIFYPEEEPFVVNENNEFLWGEGKGFYYFKTVRKINIEKFCASIKVGNYEFDKKDKTKLDLFEVFIDFSPECSKI